MGYLSAGLVSGPGPAQGGRSGSLSSGNRKIYRLSLRGNRRVNHAIHMAAITQISHRHSDGRAYYDRKITQGKTRKEALRALKRRISDAIYARLRADARTHVVTRAGPGGQTGNDSDSSAAGSHPEHRLFGQATPEPATTPRPPTPPSSPAQPHQHCEKPSQSLDSKEVSIWRLVRSSMTPVTRGRI